MILIFSWPALHSFSLQLLGYSEKDTQVSTGSFIFWSTAKILCLEWMLTRQNAEKLSDPRSMPLKEFYKVLSWSFLYWYKSTTSSLKSLDLSQCKLGNWNLQLRIHFIILRIFAYAFDIFSKLWLFQLPRCNLRWFNRARISASFIWHSAIQKYRLLNISKNRRRIKNRHTSEEAKAKHSSQSVKNPLARAF